MKNNLQRRRAIIKRCDPANADFMQLYQIFTATLRPDMSLRQFTAYYHSAKLQYIDVTFLHDGEQVAGFCAAAFYASDVDGKKVITGRAAIGFLESYQGKTLPKWMLYYKYIRYKQKYPFSKLILFLYVANPLVYSMICKYTAIVYPRNTIDTTEEIDKLKTRALFASGLKNREVAPFVVKINFDVQKGEKLMERIRNSTDKHVQFFLKHVGTGYGMTLLIIIPVSWKNIALTSLRFVVCTTKKKGKAIATAIQKDKMEMQKRSDQIVLNCRNAANLAKQYFNKANKLTENDNWKRLRTLFTK